MDVTERKPLTRSKIGVLMGGRSSEREVSLKTGESVYRSLVRSGYDAVAIDVGPALTQTMQEHSIEIAFLALHGPGGEDGAIQGFLETLGIPYTGSGVRASAIGMHKVATKTQLAAEGIPVPKGMVVLRGSGSVLVAYPEHVQIETACGRQAGEPGIHHRRDHRSQTLTMERGSSAGASVRRGSDGRGLYSWA